MKHAVSLLACWLVVLLATLAGQQGPPSLDEVLKAAGTFVSTYEQTDGLIGEEEYVQQVTRNLRRLKSDILFIKDEAFGWIEFRDVVARDGVAIRDREDRALNLFTTPNPDRLAQAKRIVAEGARFNLDPPNAQVNRTINLPLTAVRFLRPVSQIRSTFRVSRWNAESGIVTLDFSEQRKPRLIQTPDQAAASGRFDVERATGRVVSSMITITSGDTFATISVKFAWDAKADLWLPQTMDEEYRGRWSGSVTGQAKYSNYRRFKVETSETVKH